MANGRINPDVVTLQHTSAPASTSSRLVRAFSSPNLKSKALALTLSPAPLGLEQSEALLSPSVSSSDLVGASNLNISPIELSEFNNSPAMTPEYSYSLNPATSNNVTTATMLPLSKSIDDLEDAKNILPPADHFTIVRELLVKKMTQEGKQEYSEAIQRAIDHVVYETLELLSWIKKCRAGDNSDINNTVIIHYENPLFETMSITVREAGTLGGYLSEKAIHLPQSPKGDKYKFLNKEKHYLYYEDATVYIPICYGVDKHLSGDNLKEKIDHYLKKGVGSITIYLGEYNSVDHPVDKIENIANEKRKSWFEKNDAIVKWCASEPRLRIVQRAEWVKQDAYREAKDFFEKHVLSLYGDDPSTNHIHQAIMKDATTYLKKKIKGFSNNLQDDVSQEEIMSKLRWAEDTEKQIITDTNRQVQKFKAGNRSGSELTLTPDQILDRLLHHVRTAKDANEIAKYAYYTEALMRTSQRQSNQRTNLFAHPKKELEPTSGSSLTLKK